MLKELQLDFIVHGLVADMPKHEREQLLAQWADPRLAFQLNAIQRAIQQRVMVALAEPTFDEAMIQHLRVQTIAVDSILSAIIQNGRAWNEGIWYEKIGARHTRDDSQKTSNAEEQNEGTE